MSKFAKIVMALESVMFVTEQEFGIMTAGLVYLVKGRVNATGVTGLEKREAYEENIVYNFNFVNNARYE